MTKEDELINKVKHLIRRIGLPSFVKFSVQRAEMYCRAITNNIMGCLLGLFEQSSLYLFLHKI